MAQRDIENNQPITTNKDFIGGSDDKMYNGPMARFEPIRTDPIKALKDRQKRLEDRITAKGMPEIHFVGHITSGQGLIMDTTEGAFCRYMLFIHTCSPTSSSVMLLSHIQCYLTCDVRWKVYFGKAWEHLSGEIIGQTQVSYCRTRESETLSFNHPLDVHFAVAGLQVCSITKNTFTRFSTVHYSLLILVWFDLIPFLLVCC